MEMKTSNKSPLLMCLVDNFYNDYIIDEVNEMVNINLQARFNG